MRHTRDPQKGRDLWDMVDLPKNHPKDQDACKREFPVIPPFRLTNTQVLHLRMNSVASWEKHLHESLCIHPILQGKPMVNVENCKFGSVQSKKRCATDPSQIPFSSKCFPITHYISHLHIILPLSTTSVLLWALETDPRGITWHYFLKCNEIKFSFLKWNISSSWILLLFINKSKLIPLLLNKITQTPFLV